MIGTLLGERYEIIEKIGSGGMAIVYKAKCKLLNRYVAVKILRDELQCDKEFVERFYIEAQSAASLSHHNIVSVYDVGHQGGIYYIVMEFIDGITLKELIRTKGSLSWSEAACYLKQLLSAIDHAHKKHIIHRDIKPHNILITKEGNVKVTDFGIARAVTTSTIIRGGNIIGSVHYFSPEQAESCQVDYKSDIYSIGILTYEMVTGRLPYDGDNPFSIAKMHKEQKPIEPSSYKTDLPKAFEAIILRAMEKEPRNRFQSAADMLNKVEDMLINPDIIPIKKFEDTIPVPIPENNPDKAIDKKGKKPLSEKEQKRQDTIAVVTAIITGVLLLSIISFFVFSVMPVDNLFKFGSSEIKVPNIVGQLQKDAEANLKNVKLKLVETGREFSENYDEGYIISQEPKDGMTVKVPYDIKVVISKGRKTVVIGNYVNRDFRQAEQDIRKIGLDVNVKYEENETIPNDVVLKQSPSDGSEVKYGDFVTLYVSGGKTHNKITVPNVIGMPLENAKRIILDAGLTVGDIRSIKSAIAAGAIVATDPASGIGVEAKTEISLSVSSGSEQTTPDPQRQDNTAPTGRANPYESTIVPVPTKAATTAIRYVYVKLPTDRQTALVKATVAGKTVYNKVHKTSEGGVDIPISADANAKVVIYIDGVPVN